MQKTTPAMLKHALLNPVVPQVQPASTIRSYSEIRQGRLRVADFQRDYGWHDEHVGQLFATLVDGVSRHHSHISLGQLCTYPGPDGLDYLVDGQQRLTTLSLMFAASYSRLKAAAPAEAEKLKPLLFLSRDLGELSPVLDFSYDPRANEAFRALINYGPSSDDTAEEPADGSLGGSKASKGAGKRKSRRKTKVMKQQMNPQVIRRTRDPKKTATRLSAAEAMQNNFKIIVGLIDEYFGDDYTMLVRFWKAADKAIHFTVLQQPDRKEAILYYTRANTATLPLTQLALVKNTCLGACTTPAEQEEFNKHWTRLMNSAGNNDAQAMDYFASFMSGLHSTPTNILVSTHLFSYFNAERDHIAPDHVAFVRSLADHAEMYNKVAKGQLPSGTANDKVRLLSVVAHKKTAHRQILSSANHLNDQAFASVCDVLARVMGVGTLAKWNGGNTVTRNADICQRLRRLPSNATAKQVKQEFETVFSTVVEEVLVGASAQMRVTNPTAAQARVLLMFAEVAVRGEAKIGEVLTEFANCDIEHVMPKKREDWDGSLDGDKSLILPASSTAHLRLGNLVMMQKANNRAAKNSGYSMKRPELREGPFLTTKIIGVEDTESIGGQRGRNTKDVLASLRAADADGDWSEERITRRTVATAELFVAGIDPFKAQAVQQETVAEATPSLFTSSMPS